MILSPDDPDAVQNKFMNIYIITEMMVVLQ